MGLMETPLDRAPILVLAMGNPSRGDDAFGPVLATRLQDWLQQQAAPIRARVEVIVELQLMVEHATDLSGRHHVLFVDASASGQAPASEAGLMLQRLAIPHKDSLVRWTDSHRCTPAQLLGLCATLMATPPPPADLLSLRGRQFELDTPLSDPVEAQLPQAWSLMQSWLEQALQD